jgi:Tol biopolymer transport system component
MLLVLLPPNNERLRSSTPRITSPKSEWKLAFVRGRSIWVANGNGTIQHKVIENADAPCWSPDRKQIAFARQGEIWVALANGSRQQRLTHKWNLAGHTIDNSPGYEGGRDVDIAWGAIDNLIDFSHWESFKLARAGSTSSKVIQCSSIYEIPANKPASNELDVRFDVFNDGADFHASLNDHPAWSADGNQMAFTRNGDIWVAVRSQAIGESSWPWTHRTSESWGWEVTRLAATASYDAPTHRASRENEYVTHLSWSPDGKHLVYGIRRVNGSGSTGIYLLNVTKTSGEISATPARCELDIGEDPCFSPDSRFIAYSNSYNNNGTSWIFAQSIDGKRIVPLIKDGKEPAW